MNHHAKSESKRWKREQEPYFSIFIYLKIISNKFHCTIVPTKQMSLSLTFAFLILFIRADSRWLSALCDITAFSSPQMCVLQHTLFEKGNKQKNKRNFCHFPRVVVMTKPWLTEFCMKTNLSILTVMGANR